MVTEIRIQQLHKNVAVWSSRKGRRINIEVDYQRVEDGKFTLLHITRLQDTVLPTTPRTPALLPLAA